jgi:hypothetical protein
MKSDVSFHLLHGLVDVSVQDCYGAKSLQVGERLFAVVGAPAPLGIDGPEGDVRENNNGRAAFETGDVFLKPFELLGAEIAQSTCLEVQHIDQADEMSTVLIKAVPAIALGPLAETLVKHLAVVAENIMLTGNVKDLVGFETLERFGKSVELFGLRELREVARVKNERWGRWQRVDLGNRFAQGCGHIWIGILIKSDVAVADLHEA